MSRRCLLLFFMFFLSACLLFLPFFFLSFSGPVVPFEVAEQNNTHTHTHTTSLFFLKAEKMEGQSNLKGVFRNRNVVLVIAFCFVDGACFSVWMAQIFPVFVHRIGGDKAVGWSAAASGMAQIAGAAVAGYVGDKIPRKESIRVAAFCGIVAVAATLVAVNLLVMPAIYITQAVWGVYLGVASTSIEALFADSVLSGHRAFIYNFKWIIQTVCYCVGYVVALVMLLQMGNDWSLDSIKLVMTVGLAVHPLAHLILLFMRDEDALQHGENDTYFIATAQDGEKRKNKERKNWKTGALSDLPEAPLLKEGYLLNEDSEAATISDRQSSTHNASSQDAKEITLPCEQRETEEETEESSGIYDVSRHVDEEDPSASCFRGFCSSCHRSLSAVPYFVCIADFWMAVGSGMTVQYMTLFLVTEFHMAPTWIMSSYIAISFGTALFSTVLRYVGEHYIGRLPAVITVRLIGTTLLLLLALLDGPNTGLGVVLALVISRNSLMNSPTGVTRSVIMDCVPKSSRAKWSAFESFASFTWAGSAVIGGYIADAKGYQCTFFTTSMVHYVGTCVLVPAAIASRNMERHLRQLKRAERNSD
ncbi:hypothetical protein MOQ_005825 [Trypanosoma cruzi marinkellei]|uniref:Major facilitator superfamily (MFS) profile domain-containing protein n=1 Tax=Trypanosoma cruzi marinkellei TaxID=85056 RepID=K2NND1_TRYCR|nr:hypothetical protein MOQ_005825 [Trypanosoma cruzi marinkellei]